MLDHPTQRFVEQVAGLEPGSLAMAFDRSVALRRAGGKEASRATRPSASENSELEHLVRESLLPRADELNGAREGLHADAKSAAVIAARAVLKRDQLTQAQYDVLVLPFVEAGIDVPSHD
ncbi:hypothetical protein ACGGZK_08360 [Agromyces sp. MMS24-K17]|uniref:hypothetical protein n=1 Tax=Agromyces sp. MMS24-K17 TaxID=3372850 RepID=UPI0037546E9F